MTVAELIAKLQELPQDARVVTDSAEAGLLDVETVEVIEIVVGSRGPCSEMFGIGPHELWFPPSYEGSPESPHETAVYLPR